MFQCKRCDAQFRDGVQCSVCLSHLDFSCAGITEGGYRKLGDRKATWRCASCKNSTSSIPTSGTAPSLKPPTPADLSDVMAELKRLSDVTASLPQLMDSVKSIHAELTELKGLKSELTDVKESINFMHSSVDTLSSKISDIDKEIQVLL